MILKNTFWYFLIILSLLCITSLQACDRNKKSGEEYSLYYDYIWEGDVIPNTYNGGWGYPRCVDVSNYDAECYPWISGNGKYLLFGSINFNGPPRPGHHGTENWDLYISEWDSIGQRWGEERNMGSLINTSAQERRPSCTWNCDTLYFSRYDNDNKDDIYMSTFDGSDWTTPVILPLPVNTNYNEEHPAISPDSKRLYFTSDRPGGHGGSDIWVAHWDGFSWSTVENFGPAINTPNEETRPFESYDGKRFYFSNNHGQPRPGISYGGASDIYVSTRTDTGWGPVYLVAAPINCDLPACSACESPDGTEIWFGSEAWEGSRGDEDIWVAKKGYSYPPRVTHGYDNWIKTGELKNAIYVYDLEESPDGTIYAGTACAESQPVGKVFKTTNTGTSWKACADLPGAMTVYSLIVKGDTIYAGTYPKGDVFKSVDRGNSWVNTANLPGVTAARCLVHLRNGDILVGTSPYDVSGRNRIYRTSDGGKSWNLTALLTRINPGKFFFQTSKGAIFTGGFGIDSEIIIYKSIDNGISWDSLTVIPEKECHYDADGFYETKSGILYVTGYIPSHGVRTGAGYVYKSTDHGTTWTMCSKVVRGDGVHNGRVYSITEDLYNRIYIGTQPAPDSVVFASSNVGTSWYSTGGLDGAYECLCLLRASDGTIYAGTTPNGDVFKYIPQPPTRITEKHPTTSVKYRLSQNYPNPFNSTTIIPFQIPIGGRVTIAVYDILGKLIKTVFDDDLESGSHEVRFSGYDDNGSTIANGVYLFRMEAGGFIDVKKLLYMK
jgi:photosystem II stability/assembly factor-like uncharacterized protein